MPSPFPLNGLHYVGPAFNAPIEFGWELDLWGKIRRQNEGARADAAAAADAVHNILLGIQAEVAMNYFKLRTLDNEMRIVREAVGWRNEALKIAKARVQAGAGSELEEAQAETEERVGCARGGAQRDFAVAVADAPGLDAEHRGGGELEAAAAQGVAEAEGDPQAVQAVGCEGQGEPAEVGGDEQARGGAGIEAEAEAGAAQTRPREAEAEAGVEQGAELPRRGGAWGRRRDWLGRGRGDVLGDGPARWLGWGLLLGAGEKLALELEAGTGHVGALGIPVAPPAHLYGFVGGCVGYFGAAALLRPRRDT